MAGSIYPKGEEIQRGLKMIYDLAREEDRKSKEKDDSAIRGFFEAFPEYRPRQVATMWYRGRDAVEQELDTALYYIDRAKVEGEYNGEISELENYKRMGFEGFNADLASLYESRGKAYDDLNRMYGKRKKTPSVYMAPHDRALFALREQYYNIEGSNPNVTEAGRRAFLVKLQGRGMGATYYVYAKEADSTLDSYSQRIANETGNREPLYRERDRAIESLTAKAITEISAADFLNFLEQSKQEPTDKQAKRAKQMDALRTLFATDRSNWPEVFKTSPELQKAYGNNPDPTVAGQLDTLWGGYWTLQPQSLERQDWVDMNLEALNDYRRLLGLNPLQPTKTTMASPMTASYDPVAEAMAQIGSGE